MTDELIARLRCYPANRLCRQVADALEAQARRIAELEAALKGVVHVCGNITMDEGCPLDRAIRHARAALGEKE